MNNLDSKEAILDHKKIINKKIFLKNIYIDFYKIFKSTTVSKKGPLIEVGSGGGFLKKFIPKVITTDVLVVDGIDKKLDLEKINLKNNSVSAFYMLNVFHHIKNPKKALKEMQRCLVTGGKIIMIEPWPTLFSKFIYKHFHHETFDINSNWKVSGIGRMSDANGALPWIIFKRDKNKFDRLFSNLKVESIIPHTPFKYLSSGGLSHPQYLPNSFYPLLLFIEKLLTPLNNYFAMFATVILIKKMTEVRELNLVQKFFLTFKSIHLYQIIFAFFYKGQFLFNFKNDTKLYIRSHSTNLAESIIINGNLEYPLNFINTRNDMTIIDIGSNIGTYSIYLSKYLSRFNIDYKIYAIEPELYNFKQLSKNININHMTTRIMPFNVAISNKNGVGRLEIRKNDDSHRLTPNQKGIKTQKVYINTLETFCLENNIKRIDVLKIDIEGGEYTLLLKSIGFIKNNVNLMFVKLHPINDNNNLDTYTHFLRVNGFKILKIIMNRTVVAINKNN